MDDDNNWDDENQSFAGGHQQQYHSGNPQSQSGGFEQPPYGGEQQQQRFQPAGQHFAGAHHHPQSGQHQQQQFGGQHVQTGWQQQQQYNAQHFPTRGQQSQRGQLDVGGQASRHVSRGQDFQYASQQARVPSGGQQQPSNSLVGRGFSSNSGTNGQNAPAGFGQAVSRATSQGNVSAPAAPQNFPYAFTTHLPRQQFTQHPMATRGPCVQQISNGYTSPQSSGDSFNQQILLRHRPLSSQSQSISGQQQHMGNSSQIPMAMRPSSGQIQSQFTGGPRQPLSNSQQFSLLASQSQTGVQSQFIPRQLHSSGYSQQFPPTAAQFQPGLLQYYAAGALHMSNQQFEGIRQTATISQQYSPSASQFQQSGSQQNWANNQSDPPASQYQGLQPWTQGQLGLNDPSFLPSRRTSQQSGLYTYQAEERGEGGEDDPCQRARHWTGRWLDQNNTGEGHHVDRPIPEDMVEDPLYQQTLLQVRQWQQQYNVPMTRDQQARLALQETWKKQDSFKDGKRLAELDEDDLEEDVIEEAVRDAKRQRTHREHLNFHANAQKIFALGPELRPESMNMDNGSTDDDQVTSYDLDLEILGVPAEFKGEFSGKTLSLADNPFKKPYEHKVFDRSFRLIESICCDWTFMIEVTKHLRVKDIITLYSISRTFHDLVNLRFQSTIAAWAQEISPSGWKVFHWKFYGNLAMKDPAGKPWAMPGPVPMPRPPWAGPSRVVSRTHSVRSVPSLKYLAMISQRETRTRDILACLARAGHRLPETMHVTLKKMWMLMDISTNNLRRAFIRNENIWTPRDLYNAQMFYVKLQMRFNEPIFGPKSTVLADTFLGLRGGLSPLWKLLRRKDYLEGEQILQQRLKYYCRDSLVQHHLLVGTAFAGVHPNELGNEHKEGWGAGKIHLSRPDELVVEESVRRNLHMEKHIIFMMFWGHVDWKKRLNLVPTEEEMYMSDDELPPLPKTGKYAAHGMWGRCGNVPFELDNWQPKHAMKARWKTLTRQEKLAIIKDDEAEQMRALPFEKDVGEKFWDLPYNANDRAHPDYPGGDPANRHVQEPESEDADGDTQMREADEDDDGSLDSSLTDEVNDDPERENQEQIMGSTSAEGEGGSLVVKYEYIYEEESLPMPDTIEDEDVIANWYDLDPYLQQKIIDEHDRVQRQDEKDERTLAIIVNDEMERLAMAEADQAGGFSASAGLSTTAGPSHQTLGHPSPYTSPMKKQPKRYKYPGITDPIALALLERYDRFAPEEFRTDVNGNILRGEQGPSESGSSSTTRTIELSDYDEYDDEDLKALADEDYDSDEVDFDVDSYQKFLERIGGDDGFIRNPGAEDNDKDKEEEKAKAKRKTNVKGKGKSIAGESDDDEDGGYDRDDMVFEGDLDDDLPLPKYDFRKF